MQCAPAQDTLWCEQCGEAEQEIHLQHAGLCGDCFASTFREEVSGFFWAAPCGHPLFNKSGQLVAVCVKPCGTEHAHAEQFEADEEATAPTS